MKLSMQKKASPVYTYYFKAALNYLFLVTWM